MKRGKFYLRRDLNGEEMVEFRLDVIKLAKQHGIEATKRAFGVSKSTIYRWKRCPKTLVITPQRYDLYQEDLKIQEKGNGIEG
jgi:DNA invertase Pin-like site-specific DNA recombinase